MSTPDKIPTPPELLAAIARRVERDVLPESHPHIVDAWTTGERTFAVVADDDNQKIAVDILAMTDQGSIQVARFDGETLGFHLDEDGWSYAG